MTLATICIPSNRTLVDSVEPLWSALNYAQQHGMAVVISDNSGDPEKTLYFENGPQHLTFLADGPAQASANVMHALSAVTTEFVMMLGDDDYLASAEGAVPFDFAGLGPDYIGVKPRIELVGPDKQTSDVNDFTIDNADAAGRVLEYTQKMKGGNSTYYSFFRTRELRDIYALFTDHHPTKAGNSDFAVVYALAASGRIAHDPATTLRYDNSRWADFEAASVAMDGLLLEAGLPPEVRDYLLLFHFLDSYVLMFRATSNLPLIDRYKSGYAVAMVFLKRLLYRIQERPIEYSLISDLTPALREAVESSDPDLDRIFHIAGLIADRLKPGLKEQYDRYLLTAVHGSGEQ